MSANPAEFIEGAAQVVEYYGYWATFHDAELVSLSIMPEAETITAIFEYGDMTDDESRSGLSRITLEWQDVVSYVLQADYTRYQMNTLHRISFVEQDGWINTELVPIDGVSGKVRSRKVQVTQFETLPE